MKARDTMTPEEVAGLYAAQGAMDAVSSPWYKAANDEWYCFWCGHLGTGHYRACAYRSWEKLQS